MSKPRYRVLMISESLREKHSPSSLCVTNYTYNKWCDSYEKIKNKQSNQINYFVKVS